MSKWEHNPGSPKAVMQGCTCAVLDNSHGAGIGDGMFWINETCPLHVIQNTRNSDSAGEE